MHMKHFLVACVIGVTSLPAVTLGVPNTFSSGGTIKASEMN